MGYIIRNGTNYSSDNSVTLTQAQYDALVQAGTVEPNTTYFITDGGGILSIDMIYPIGSIYISVNNVNPGTYLTGTTWVAFASGRTLVGVDTTQTEFDTVEETGGEKTHLLTSAESGVPSQEHTYTRPTVSSSGYIANGITGGSHSHPQNVTANAGSGGTGVRQDWDMDGAGFGTYAQGISTGPATHTHNLPNHTHTLTGGGVANNTAADASQSHNNLQPYITTYMWKRVS